MRLITQRCFPFDYGKQDGDGSNYQKQMNDRANAVNKEPYNPTDDDNHSDDVQ